MFSMRTSVLVLVCVLAATAFAGDDTPFADVAPPSPGAARATEPEIRTWTDNTGQFHLRASLAGSQDGKASLKLEDGKIKIVPLEKLSQSDQAYVREFEAQKQKESERARAAAKPPGERAQGVAPWADASPSPAAAARPADAWKWLSEVIIPQQKVTDGLRGIWTMPPDAAAAQVAPMRAAVSFASAQGKLAAALLIAAADDRAGRREIALGEYRQLAADGKDTAFGVSASFRAIVLEGQAVKEKLSAMPAAEGWFLMSDAWTQTNCRVAADAVPGTTEDRPGFWYQGIAGLLGARSVWWGRVIAVLIFAVSQLVFAVQQGVFYKQAFQAQSMPKEAAGCSSFFGAVLGESFAYVLYWGVPINGLGWGMLVAVVAVIAIIITSVVTSN